MAQLRAAVYAQAPAPTLDGLVYVGEDQPGVDDLFAGSYQGPNFQAGDPFHSGTPPYTDGGGNLVLDDAGVPQRQRSETLRVAITVPKGDPPAAGWPVVIYAHGTGGDYQSFIARRLGPPGRQRHRRQRRRDRQAGDDRNRPGAARHARRRPAPTTI